MSNQVALFTNGTLPALPEHLRGIEIDEQTKSLAGGGGGLRISIKGGVFRMLNDGEEIARNDDRSMNVVIIRSSPDNARNYYAEEYTEGEATPPTCWSSNGQMPEPEVKEKQAATCATCPQNVAGSGNNGSRACRFSRSLAVVLEGDLPGKIFKVQLPATSLFGKVENNVMPLQAYGKLLVQNNLPVNAVVTELRFDTSVTQPKLGFKAARYLTEAEYAIVKQQGETPEAILATKTTTFQQDSGEPKALALPGAPAAAAVAAAPAPAPAVVEQPATVAATVPVTPKKRTRAAPAAAAAPAPAPAPAPAAPVKKMTEKAAGATYEDFVSEGWTDDAMVAEGYMELVKPTPPKPPAAPKVPAVPATPVVVANPATAAPAVVANTAAMLAGWDADDE